MQNAHPSPNSALRSRPLSATQLLRNILEEVDGRADLARDALASRTSEEARSAARILRRTLGTAIGATHVRYAGGGAFKAEPPKLHLVAVDEDGSTRTVGTWDDDRWGRLKLFARSMTSETVDRVREEMAPASWLMRVVTTEGRVVAIAPASAMIRSASPPAAITPATTSTEESGEERSRRAIT